MARDALFCNDGTADLPFSHGALRRALGDHGLLTADGDIKEKEFTDDLQQKYAFLERHPDFRRQLSRDSIQRLCRSLRRADSWRSPQQSLLLIDWLFGSWRAYRQQCKWQSAMDTQTSPVASNAVLPPDEIGMHRAVCLEFLAFQQKPKRRAFFLYARRSFNWLCKNDIEWLDFNFPDGRINASQGELF